MQNSPLLSCLAQLQTGVSVQSRPNKKKLWTPSSLSLYLPSWLMICSSSSVWLLACGALKERRLFASNLIGPDWAGGEALFGLSLPSCRQPPPRRRYIAPAKRLQEWVTQWSEHKGLSGDANRHTKQLICAADQITSKHSRVKNVKIDFILYEASLKITVWLVSENLCLCQVLFQAEINVWKMVPTLFIKWAFYTNLSVHVKTSFEKLVQKQTVFPFPLEKLSCADFISRVILTLEVASRMLDHTLDSLWSTFCVAMQPVRRPSAAKSLPRIWQGLAHASITLPTFRSVSAAGISIDFSAVRRYYQIRTTLKVSPKLPVKVEVTLPRAQGEYKSKSAFAPTRLYV